jgi:ABC-type sugar transport system permease subunit
VRGESKSIFSFLIVPFLFISIFLLGPIFFSTYLSFCSWDLHGPIRFVGINNFIKIFTISRYQKALLNNVVWIAGVTLAPMFIGLGLAYLLSDELKGKWIFTGLLWIPFAIAPVALGYIFTFVFDFKLGLLNLFLSTMGLGFLQRPWLSSWPLNTLSLVISSWWVRIPFCAIVYLAGMTSIPRGIIDASNLDGSIGFHRLRKIIFPLLRPFTILILIWSVLYAFQDNFGLIWVMTEGGPYRSSEVLNITMYKEAFVASNIGYASALAFLSMVIVLGVAIGTSGYSAVEVER